MRFIFSLLLMVSALGAAAFEVPETAPAPQESLSSREVMELLNRTSPQPIEGIWDFPDRAERVAILRLSPHDTSVFRIVCIEGEDLIPESGATLGWCVATADPNVWRVTLYTSREGEKLVKPKEWVGNLSAPAVTGAASLKLERSGWTIRINPAAILPYIRRLVRLQKATTGTEAPFGLQKVYPIRQLRTL